LYRGQVVRGAVPLSIEIKKKVMKKQRRMNGKRIDGNRNLWSPKAGIEKSSDSCKSP
jgi:hypothetical protein